MAPEILRYEKYDAKADLWSVGAVLFEMVTGKPPFRAQNHVELLRRIERGEDKIKFPDEKTPKAAEPGAAAPTPPIPVPDDIKALIRSLLKRNPTERMTFDDFFVAGQAVATSGAAAALRRPPDAEGGGSVTRSNPGLAGSIKSSSAEEGAFVRPQNVRRISGNKNVSVPPSPTPSVTRRVPSFVPKYVVGSSSRDEIRTPPTAPIEMARERSADGSVRATPPDGIRPMSVDETPRSLTVRSRPPTVAEDDSVLGREYVVVEKQTVEINALADGASLVLLHGG